MSKHRTRRTKWSRLLSGVLCLALVLGLLPASGLIQSAGAASWADPYGEQLVEWGVMNPSSNLRLDSTITRAEFVAMCNRAFGYKKLGSTPFTDVPRSAWYAQDINIAYNAGYFNGTATNKASPLGTLTREQAAVLVARNLMLQETVGEVQNFTDSHSLSEWSRGLIGAAVAEGMINGLPDGSFSPTKNITRGEVAAMLVRVIGTPISKEGDYSELGNVYGNLTVSSSNVTLRNTIVTGNLYITGGVDLGNVLLENVTVMGRIVIGGGGEAHAAQSSVVLRNVTADEMVVDSLVDDRFVTISAYGVTDIPVTYVRSDTWLEDACEAGYGLQKIELAGKTGTLLQLAGNIKEVVNKTPFSNLQLVQGTAQKITVDEYAIGSQLLVAEGTWVGELNLDVATLVTGKGDIRDLNIAAAGCEVDIIPEHVTVRPGITATVGGEVIGSTEAAEMSSEPRLLAGYPAVVNIAPTQAEVQFAANKSGTIYWAISEVANGSVSDDDLINNPAYGGKIYEKQAGSITANSKNVYVQQVTKLVPDGSYYLSAILVDGRGNRSPSKTVAFTTPDNTVPAFVKGYPRMSKVTCEVAQVTAMANKSCQMYYALLPAGASAPTPNEFKSGAIGGNLGYSTVNMVKNVPVSITVNRSRLQEKTSYVLYLWLTDYNGANSSAVASLTFTTPDETPPVVTNVWQSAYAEKTAGVTFTINEAGTFYWAIVAEGNESFISTETDLTDLVTKIKVESGSGAIAKGKVSYKTANEEAAFTISGLDFSKTKTHNFTLYYIAKDADGNYSDEVKSISIRTLDTDPPHAWLEYSKSVNKIPQANSDIKIVFDEQVKGGPAASQTFLKLYQDVKSGSATRDDLARELNAHFQLWYVSKTGSPTQVKETGGDGNWVDFRYAIITMEGSKVVITLPGESRPENDETVIQAINLDSGASYYFQLIGVYDDAINPNALAVDKDGTTCVSTGGTASDNGNGRLYFTTLNASVDLLPNEDNDEATIGTDKIRLDIVLNIVPQSTKNVASTEYWDLIMWSDTWVNFDIYRSMDGGTTWEKATDKPIRYDPSSRNGAGVSWNAEHNDSLNIDRPQKVTGEKGGLLEGTVYTYGIHFTQVGETAETDPSKDPGSWSNKVTMRFSVVAGGKNPINDLANGPGNYNAFVEDGDIDEIGVAYTKTGTDTVLTLSKQFKDTSVPEFTESYPEFDSTANTITMDVMLERPGTLYYVVAPVTPKIQIPTNTGKTAIDSSNDTKTDGNKTYIPTGYKDIQAVGEQYIWFLSGGNAADGSGKGVYSSPKSEFITGGKTRYPSSQYPDIKASGPVAIGSAATQLTVTGLKPSTEYYVYIVLQGGGLADEVVQIYRVETKKAEPPAVYIAPNETTANITTYDSAAEGAVKIDSEVYWALVTWSNLPAFFNDTYAWEFNGDTAKTAYTLLDLLRNRVSGPTSRTLFDEYGESAVLVKKSGSGTSATYTKDSSGVTAASYKSEIMEYIQSTNNNYPTQAPLEVGKANYISTGAAIPTTDKKFPAGYNIECGILAMAKTANATEGPENYGFAAVRGMYRSDPEPPEFVAQTAETTSGKRTISYIAAGTDLTTADDSSWRSQNDLTKLMGYKFSGQIQIEFTKPLYMFTYVGNDPVRKAVVGDTATNFDDSTQVKFSSAAYISNSSAGVTVSGDGSIFTIKFSNMKMGDTITIFPAGRFITNSSPTGKTSNYYLTLEFAPTLTSEQVEKGGYLPNTRWGGFIATWATR